MKDKINLLTDEQAQHALLRFYDLLPEAVWQGSKPTFGDLEFWREEIEAAATPEIQAFLEAVQDKADPAIRGKTARALLTQMAEYEQLQPYVEQAVEEATVPHMAPLPVIIIAATVVLAAIPSKVVSTPEGGLIIEWNQLDKATEFIKALKDLLKEAKLPFS